MYTISDRLKSPVHVAVELTSQCNHACTYCYNYWRHEHDVAHTVLSREKLDVIIDDIVANDVFNVVLTGGEPFLNYEALLHGVKRLTEAGTLVSCNTNMAVATADQLRELRDAGLPHILTSLPSYDPDVTDRVCNRKGSFGRVVRAIRNAVAAGIKISVNSIPHRSNVGHTYKTAVLADALGVSNFFVTRVVPSTSCPAEIAEEFALKPEEYYPILDDAIRAKEDTNLTIGSLIQYPVCFLGDVEKYADCVL